MPTLSDCRFDTLRGLGLSGSTSDMLLQWLQQQGATSNSLPDAWREMLDANLTEPTGHRNDDWYTLLGDLGYEGSMNDRELAFWCEGDGSIGGGILYFDGTTYADLNTPWAANGIPTEWSFKFNADAVATGIEQRILSGEEGGVEFAALMNNDNPWIQFYYRDENGVTGTLVCLGIDVVAGQDTHVEVKALGESPVIYINNQLVEGFFPDPVPADARQPAFSRIGMKYDGTQGFAGTIWDVNLGDGTPIQGDFYNMGNNATYGTLDTPIALTSDDFYIKFNWRRESNNGLCYLYSDSTGQSLGAIRLYNNNHASWPDAISLFFGGNRLDFGVSADPTQSILNGIEYGQDIVVEIIAGDTIQILINGVEPPQSPNNLANPRVSWNIDRIFASHNVLNKVANGTFSDFVIQQNGVTYSYTLTKADGGSTLIENTAPSGAAFNGQWVNPNFEYITANSIKYRMNENGGLVLHDSLYEPELWTGAVEPTGSLTTWDGTTLHMEGAGTTGTLGSTYPVETGETYRVQFDYASGTSSAVYVRVGGGGNVGTLLNPVSGSYDETLTAGGTGYLIQILSADNIIDITNFSVEAVSKLPTAATLNSVAGWPGTLARITVNGTEFSAEGTQFKAWGFAPLNETWERQWYQGIEPSTAMSNWIQGDANQNKANAERMHLQLWDFIESPTDDIAGLRPILAVVNRMLGMLADARKNNVYILICGCNTLYGASESPDWFDLLGTADRWEAYQFFWETVVQAVLDDGSSSTVIGYDLINEPQVSSDPVVTAEDWYGREYEDTGYYFNPYIARDYTPGDNNAQAQAFITKLTDAIHAIDADALCTVGVVDGYLGVITLPFGPDNTQALLDFLSPHLYPSGSGSPSDEARQVGYVDDWAAAATKPLLCGETISWATTDAENQRYLQKLVDTQAGILSKSYGYGPSQFTNPPALPRYPADPDEAPAAYLVQKNSLILGQPYRGPFLGEYTTSFGPSL